MNVRRRRSASPDDIALADRMKVGREQIVTELQKIIVGQDEVIAQVLMTLFVGGNSLIVGAPGLAKTLLIHTMARVLDLKFSRIQFTPDLMPSDITGTDLVQEDAATGRRQMVFAPGPIFANIVLADEINRTPPKTQSALLEAMQEHRVTVQGKTYQLDEPFYVFATQNPIELEGTYPLPEAQLDRFMFHIIIEHPPYDEELDVVRTTTAMQNPQLERPVTGDDLVAFQRLVRKVPVAEPVMRHALDIVRASRPKNPDAHGLRQEVGGVRRQRARGAVPGARRQGARADERPLSRQLRGHPRAGAPGAAPPHHHQLPRAVGRRHDRHPSSTGCSRPCRCRDRGCEMSLPQERNPTAIPGARFMDPGRARAHREPGARVARGVRRLHQRAAQGAVLRRVGRLRRASRLRAGRRHPAHGLAAVGADRSLLHQGVRSRDEHELLGAARRVEVDGLRQPRHHEARLRAHPDRVPDQPRAPSARSRRLRRLRQRHRRARAAVGQAHGDGAARARSAEAGAARAA